MAIIWVFLGGGCGSVCRWGLSLWLKRYAVVLGGIPIHTLMANFLGCIVIGLVTAWMSKHENPQLAMLLVTGVCGGFTTFSTFSLEMVEMLRSGQTVLAVVYVALSLAICLSAVALGIKLLS